MSFPIHLTRARIWKYALWAAVVWVAIFWRRGFPSLLDPDEAHYAQLTREMMRAGNWMVPLLDGTPFIDKPVLFHWLQAASITFLGESELALRLPSALAALVLIATTWWLGAKLFTAEIGESAAMMFVTLPATFVLASIGMIDMVYTALLFGGMACLIVAALKNRPTLETPGYLLLAFAIMTKGPVALVLPALLIGAGLLSGGELRAAIGRLAWIRGLGVAALAACPWFIWMWGRFGDQFLTNYVLAGNVWYFTEPIEFSKRTTSATFYLRIFAAAFFPWSTVVIGRLMDNVRQWRHHPAEAEVRVLWLWLLVVIGFFTAARFRLDHYIFPMAPACCLIAAHAWDRATTDDRWFWTRMSMLAIAAAMIVGGVVTSVAIFRINLGLRASAITLPLALVAGGSVLGWQIMRRHRRPWPSVRVPILTLTAAYAVVVVIGLPVLEESRPTAPLGRWIAEHTTPTSTIGIYRVNDWEASIRYYADRQIVRLEHPEELAEFFDRFPDAYVVMVQRDARRLIDSGIDVREAAGRPAIVGRTGRYFRKQIWGRLVVVKRPQPPRLGGPTT